MAGTGLPIPQSGVLAQAPGVVDGDQYSAASAWRQLANAGERLRVAATNDVRQDALLARAGHLADQDNAIRSKATELEDKYRNDPAGFQSAWKGFTDGTLSSTIPEMVPTARRTLGAYGDAAYGRTLDRKYSLDRAANAEKIGVTIGNASDDLSAIAMRGGAGSPEYLSAQEKLRGAADAAVSLGLWTKERADQTFSTAVGNARAEAVLLTAQKAYAEARSQGVDAMAAATKVVDDGIINNPDIPLSAAERRAYASKIKADLGAEEAARRHDLTIARSAANDAMNAMRGGVRVAPETVDNLSDQLKAAGDQAGAARLHAAAVRSDYLRDLNRRPFSEQVTEVKRLSLGVVPPTSADEAEAKTFLRTRLASGQTPAAIDGMSANLSTRLAGLIQAAPPGVREKLGVYSGFRTTERQQQLWEQEVRKRGSEAEARRWVAPPGRSNHNHGNAADLSYNGESLNKAPKEVVDWLHRNAGAYGLKFPLANENWHVEVAETRRGVSADLTDKIVGTESGYDPTAQNPLSSATGGGQFIDSTWLATVRKHRPDLTQGKTPEQVLALRGDMALSREMTAAYARDNTEFLQNAGVPIRDGTVYLAHFAGPAGAVQVFKADPSTPVERVLGEDKVAANPFLRGMTAGDVVAWADQKMAGGGADSASTGSPNLRLVRDAQDELGKEVTRQWTKIRGDLDAGVRPSPTDLSDLIAGARLAGDDDTLEDLADRLGRYDLAREAGQSSLPQQDAAVSSLEQAGASGLLTPGRAAWIRDVAAIRDETVRGLENDPVSLIAKRFPDRFRAPDALDVTNSAKFQEGLRQRTAMVEFGRQVYGSGPLSVLGPGDLAVVQSVLDGPDPVAKARLAADLTQALPEGVRMATWAKLGSKGPAAALTSFAGGMMPVDPDVATGIFRGTAALAAEPRYAPKEGTEGQAFREGLDSALPPTAFGGASRTGETGAYAVLREAVRARYADLSATVGDTSGRLDENRLDRAVSDVTGGMLTHNGAAVVAPERGMSQANFDGILAALTDADLAGVATTSGTPVTADYLRSSASLEAAGQGRYLVRLNQDPSRPAYAVKDGQAFILDLRDRSPVDPADAYRRQGSDRRDNWRRRGVDAYSAEVPQ